MKSHNFANHLPVVELWTASVGQSYHFHCLDISVGEQRRFSRFLILLDLEAQALISVTTETRNQPPKALFYVTLLSSLEGKRKLFCIYSKGLILEIGSNKEIIFFPWVLGSGKTWMLSWLLCRWMSREVWADLTELRGKDFVPARL